MEGQGLAERSRLMLAGRLCTTTAGTAGRRFQLTAMWIELTQSSLTVCRWLSTLAPANCKSSADSSSNNSNDRQHKNTRCRWQRLPNLNKCHYRQLTITSTEWTGCSQAPLDETRSSWRDNWVQSHMHNTSPASGDTLLNATHPIRHWIFNGNHANQLHFSYRFFS